MEGRLRTLRAHDNSARTNFNDWSDPTYLLPEIPEKNCLKEESLSILEEKTHDSIKKHTNLSLSNAIEIKNLRSKIRKGSPLLSKKEVRGFRLPFHENLLLSLKEDGFYLTNEFIKDLIAADEAYHNSPDNDTPKKNTLLKSAKGALVSLSNGLMKAESSRMNGESNQEATAFLELAKQFSDAKDPSWHWIALEMFEQCIEVMANVEKPVDFQLQATAKYLYSCFLFYRVNNLNEAKIQIESSMALSEGKYWNIDETSEQNLYIESCRLLHEIYLEMSNMEMIHENTEEAIQLCRNGLLWSKVIGDKLAETEALHKLINIYLSVQQVYSVPELLASYMKLCTDLDNSAGLCEGYIMSAKYNNIIGDKTNVVEDMKNLLQVASQNNVSNMVAMAHHMLASYSLLKGSNEELMEHAVEAHLAYSKLKSHTKEGEESRCLVGVAQGQKLMADYCNLVSEADSKDLKTQNVLFQWKNYRMPFSDQKIELIPEITTNMILLRKIETHKTEEVLSNVMKRKTTLSSVSTKTRNSSARSTLLRSLAQSSIIAVQVANRFRASSTQSMISFAGTIAEDNKKIASILEKNQILDNEQKLNTLEGS